MSFPVSEIEWESDPDGVQVCVGTHLLKLPMQSVQELRDDMEEANWLARGFEKVECEVKEVHIGDQISCGSISCVVQNTFSGRVYVDETTWILHLELPSFHEVACELTLPDDEIVTVWRRVE